MVWDIIPQNKGDGLAFMYLKLSNESFAKNSLPLYFLEGNVGTSFAEVSLLADHI
jgi:hypothetical protein